MYGNATAFEALVDELDRMFGRRTERQGIRSVARGTFPPVNIGLTQNEVHVYLFAPGLEAKSFNISVQQNLLSISGLRSLPVNEKATYFRQERFDGEFRRVVTLPEDVDSERIEAQYREGVLHIAIRRRENAKPRQIQVA